MHLRIILVDDHEIVRLGLRTLISRYPHFEVVAEAHDLGSLVGAELGPHGSRLILSGDTRGDARDKPGYGKRSNEGDRGGHGAPIINQRPERKAGSGVSSDLETP